MPCNFLVMHVFTKWKAHWEGTKRNQDHKMFPLFQGNVYEINHACKRAQGVANQEDYGFMPSYCLQLCINLQYVIEELCHFQTFDPRIMNVYQNKYVIYKITFNVQLNIVC